MKHAPFGRAPGRGRGQFRGGICLTCPPRQRARPCSFTTLGGAAQDTAANSGCRRGGLGRWLAPRRNCCEASPVSAVNPFDRSFVRSFTHSFIHSFVHCSLSLWKVQGEVRICQSVHPSDTSPIPAESPGPLGPPASVSAGP